MTDFPTTTDDERPSAVATEEPIPDDPGADEVPDLDESIADEGSDLDSPDLEDATDLGETIADEAPVLDEDAFLAEASEELADVDAADDDESEQEDEVILESPYDRPGQWFVVHTYAGYENKVKSNLQSRISSMNMEDRIYEVVIPMEDVIEFKNGKRAVVQKKVFPGYLLVRCELHDDSWYVVRHTPGVTGFVGHGAKPVP